MWRTRVTALDLLATRGELQRTNVFVSTPEEAEAAERAGIDMLTVDGRVLTSEIREAAPETFLIGGLAFGHLATSDEYLRAACDLYELGAQAFYCAAGPSTVERLSAERLPVVGHVGLIPWHITWTGGFKAVGKTVDGALEVWRQVRRLEDAGAFGAEIEVVASDVARAISERTSLFLISMGSGTGCHAQYLFAEDILGANTGHYPRHSKRYVDLNAEYARLQSMRIAAFREFADEVSTGGFPEEAHLVQIDPSEFERFREALESETSAQPSPSSSALKS
jgi:3-methyl-2-oxobutanoate hydroxymethyltransferase